MAKQNSKQPGKVEVWKDEEIVEVLPPQGKRRTLKEIALSLGNEVVIYEDENGEQRTATRNEVIMQRFYEDILHKPTPQKIAMWLKVNGEDIVRLTADPIESESAQELKEELQKLLGNLAAAGIKVELPTLKN